MHTDSPRYSVGLLYHYIFVQKVFLGPQSGDVEVKQFYAFFMRVGILIINNVYFFAEGSPQSSASFFKLIIHYLLLT